MQNKRVPSPLQADFAANSADNSGFLVRRDNSDSVFKFCQRGNPPLKHSSQNQSDHGSIGTDQIMLQFGKVERTLFKENDDDEERESQLGDKISLFTDESQEEIDKKQTTQEIRPQTSNEQNTLGGFLSNKKHGYGGGPASGTLHASDSAFESNNFTYSESGFNPAGSLRYTMLGSSNLRGSVNNCGNQ